MEQQKLDMHIGWGNTDTTFGAEVRLQGNKVREDKLSAGVSRWG